jgi:hypothetical protein
MRLKVELPTKIQILKALSSRPSQFLFKCKFCSYWKLYQKYIFWNSKLTEIHFFFLRERLSFGHSKYFFFILCLRYLNLFVFCFIISFRTKRSSFIHKKEKKKKISGNFILLVLGIGEEENKKSFHGWRNKCETSETNTNTIKRSQRYWRPKDPSNMWMLYCCMLLIILISSLRCNLLKKKTCFYTYTISSSEFYRIYCKFFYRNFPQFPNHWLILKRKLCNPQKICNFSFEYTSRWFKSYASSNAAYHHMPHKIHSCEKITENENSS